MLYYINYIIYLFIEGGIRQGSISTMGTWNQSW